MIYECPKGHICFSNDGLDICGIVEVVDVYEAAESYARFYRDIYRDQYRFSVVGVKD